MPPQPSPVPKYGVTILTSDPETGIIDAAGKGGQLIRVSVVTTPVAFRWPEVGEAWMIRQENGTWYLDAPWPVQAFNPNASATVTVNNVQPGDAIVNSPTGTVHVLGSGDGSTDFTLSKSNTVPTGNTPLGIDANGLSLALQLLSAQKLQVQVGSAQISWPGASATSNNATINHGLGRVPQALFFATQNTDIHAYQWTATQAHGTPPSLTTLTTTGYALSGTPTASETATFWWIVFG